MANLILPKRYGQQFRTQLKPIGPVELDRSNPYGARLLLGTAFNEGGTADLNDVALQDVPAERYARDLTGQRFATHNLGGQASERSITTEDGFPVGGGPFYRQVGMNDNPSYCISYGNDGVNQPYNLATQINEQGGHYTGISRVRIRSRHSGGSRLFALYERNRDEDIISLQVRPDYALQHRLNDGDRATGTVAMPRDVWITVAFGRTRGQQWILALDDGFNVIDFETRAETSSVNVTQGQTFLGIGGYAESSNARYFLGDIDYFYFLGGVGISSNPIDDVTALARDPWQFLKPKAPLLLFPTGAEPGPIPGSGSFAGSSTLDADGRINKFGSGAFAGSATAQADGRIETPAQPGSGSFAGASSFSGDGRIGGVPQPGSGTFAGASAFAADGVLVKRAAGTFAGTSAVSADGRRIKRGAGSFVGASAAQADGRVTSGTSGSFAGTSAIQADGRVVRVYRDNANFAANSAFQGDGRIGGAQDGSGTFAGASAMSAAGRQLYRSTGIFAGSSIWSGNGIIPSQTIGPIDKPGLVSGSPQPGLTSKSPKRGVIGSQGGL